jgi:peroxiredoxin
MQLHRRRSTLQAANGQVALVSFGTPGLVRAWIQEMRVPFPILLDGDREIYLAYRLQRSYWRSWNVSTIWKYAQLLVSGRRWRGIQGDSAQLGGDFVIDPQGDLRLVYYSEDPTDRPGVDRILAALQPGMVWGAE